ncbi:MAG: exodeoxyribonuclease VII large subunit [Candidatus Omnitrophota bacterium]
MNDALIYTVTNLTKDIRFLLEGTFQEVWVEGEISNYKTYSFGHSYFSLKDENSLLSCVLFKGASGKVSFLAEDGLQVLCYGRISVYDKRGQYQLVVTKMEAKGRGALQQAFEKLKGSLYEEGLFDETRKRPLPFLPRRVGVVTSPTGAAIRDILNVGRRRCPNIEFLIRPVRVQGDGAKEEITAAIEEFNEFNRSITEAGSGEHLIDVIIVGRGGGSLEDLWPFNEEMVARAIYTSKIPIVSAVGHEIDYTISDFTADFRAPTPSAAAELIIPQKNQLSETVKKSCQRLHLAVKTMVEMLKKTVLRLRTSYVLRTPLNVFSQKRQEVDDLLSAVLVATKHLLELKRQDLRAASGKLRMLSPLDVLQRGYSITFKQGKAVRAAAELRQGDILDTRFTDGSVTSKVE